MTKKTFLPLASVHIHSVPPFDSFVSDLLRVTPLSYVVPPPEGIIDAEDVILREGTVHKKSYFLGNDTSTEDPILFKIASITKSMTAALVFKLQEMGVLSVTDPITHYLDYDVSKGRLVGYGRFPDINGITLDDLLRHTSGLKEYLENFNDLSAPQDLTRWGALKHTSFSKHPDRNFHYSNSNYLLIGMILDKLHQAIRAVDPEYEGKDTAALFKRYIFDVCSMHDSYLDSQNGDKGKIPWNKVHAGLISDEDHETVKMASTIPTFEAGGVVSSIEDVARFWEGLFTNKIISEDTRAQMLTETEAGTVDQYLCYCAGVFRGKASDGGNIYFHTGGLPGQNSRGGYLPSGTSGVAFSSINTSIFDKAQLRHSEESLVRKISPLLEGLDLSLTPKQMFKVCSQAGLALPPMSPSSKRFR